MVKWGDLKGFIRSNMLKDVPQVVGGGTANEQFTDDVLQTAARWACARLSLHTAQQWSVTIQGDGKSFQFDLPDGIIDGIEKAGLLIYTDNENSRMEFIPPVRYAPEQYPIDLNNDTDSQVIPHGYYVWYDKILYMTFAMPVGNSLEVRHFKMWTPPDGDDAILEFPIMYEQPFCYFVAAQAFDALGAQASSIRTWNQRTDSGTPSDNSLNEQSEFFLKMAQQCLSALPPQDRMTYWRTGDRDLTQRRR